MAITDSGGSAGAFADAAHTRAADTRSRRTEIQARRGETQTGGRTIFLPPKPSSRILAKTLSSAGRPLLACILGRQSCTSQQAEIRIQEPANVTKAATQA